tara:strand:+ start:17 stop:1315 length:1299 start_codon:yes stop_codon:yes gene_type:complete
MSLFDKINKGTYTLQPTVNDDLTTNKGWVSNTGSWTYNASGDYIDFATITRSQTAQQIYIDVQDADYLGSGNNLSDTKWVTRFKVRTGTQSSTQGNVLLYLGFSNNLGDSGTTQQSATMQMNFNGQANENNMTLSVSRANFETTGSPDRVNSDVYANGNLPYSTDIYMEMIRNGDVFTLKAYSDEYVTQASSTSVASATVTGISTLRYIKAFTDSEQNQSYTSSGARLYDMKIYNGTTTLSNVFTQRVVENFSGSALDTDRWNVTTTGNGTATMEDDGLKLTSDSGATGGTMINFNNIRQYSQTGSVCINVCKRTSTSNAQMLSGFTDTTGLASDYVAIKDYTSNTYKQLSTANNGTATHANSSVAIDASYHTHKIECLSSSVVLYIDGVSEVTNTTNLPNVKMQPFFYAGETAGVASAKSAHIRYMEAYNT